MRETRHSTPIQTNDDHWMMLSIIGIIGLIVLSYEFSKHTVIFFTLWRQLFLPIAEGIVWLSHTVIGRLINLVLGHSTNQAESLVHFLMNNQPNQYTGLFCKAASHFLGKYFLLLFLPIGGYLTYKIYLRTQGESEAYIRLKNAKEFTQYAKNKVKLNHQQEKPVSKAKETFLDSALSPVRFCEKNHLLIRNESDQSIVEIDSEKAHLCFVRQLGKNFKNMEILLNGQYGWVVSQLIQSVPEKHRLDAIQYATQGHRYDTTVILSLLYAARRFNAVPLINLIPLKNTHRALWYAIASAGRKTIFVEGAGIMAQYEHEMSVKQVKLKIKPQNKAVYSAVEGLIEAVIEQPNELDPSEPKNLWANYDPTF